MCRLDAFKEAVRGLSNIDEQRLRAQAQQLEKVAYMQAESEVEQGVCGQVLQCTKLTSGVLRAG